jgi:hypothetical protein
MSDPNAPVARAMVNAKEHLAGIKAAQAFHQELAAAHLLRTQSPISREPWPDEKDVKGA